VAREMGGTQTTGGEGTRAVGCMYGEEIYWLEAGCNGEGLEHLHDL